MPLLQMEGHFQIEYMKFGWKKKGDYVVVCFLCVNLILVNSRAVA